MKNRIPNPIRFMLATIIVTGLLAAVDLARAQTLRQYDYLHPDVQEWQVSPATNPASGFLGTVIGDAQSIWSSVQSSGVLSATNYAFEPYATYAPSAPQGRRFGAGALVIYNLNNNLGAGIGGDYLGKFSMVSADLTFQVPLRPFSFAGGVGTNIVVSPFALVGVGKGLSASDSIMAITDVGGYISYGHWLGGTFNSGLAWGQWSGSGQYAGERYHIFGGWSATPAWL